MSDTEIAISGPGTHMLRVQDLRIETTRGAPIVDSVTFSVAPGEILAIVGESGCGKTTTGLALLGFVRPGTRIAAGDVLLGETDVLALAPDAIRDLRGGTISYVPQDPAGSLDPRQRVSSQVGEMLQEHPRAHTRTRPKLVVRDLLDRVGLPASEGLDRRYPFEISGGQQQRVAIAMALACGPEVVVLDEPTTGLDVSTQRRILDLVRGLAQASSSAYVYITHDLAVVDDLAHRVAVMYAGRIVELGPKDDLFRAPEHPYTALLLRSAPRLVVGQRTVGIPGGAPSPGEWPVGCPFEPRCPIAIADCGEAIPPLSDRGNGRSVRCIRAGERLPLSGTPSGTDSLSHASGALLLRVDGLRASFGAAKHRSVVLRDVSFSVATGECVALVGESGSGKTTLGRCIVGLHAADSGRIEFHGESVSYRLRDRPERARRAIQMVFQNPDRSLNPVRTVAGTLERSLRLAGVTGGGLIQSQSVRLLDRVRLPTSALSRFPRELSGGERQRVAIAAALALGPTLLVCDEVTSALDVSVQASVVELLKELRRDGLALLFITHNLALVASIAERLVVLEAGVVRDSGLVETVLFRPTDGYTQRLLADVPRITTEHRP